MLVLEIGARYRGRADHRRRAGRRGRASVRPDRRLAGELTAAPGPLPGRTLGECLGAPGLVRQYQAAGGPAAVRDGAGLAAAARAGDELAGAVFGWAAREVGATVARLRLLCDPGAIVIGGGLAQAFDLLAPGLSDALPAGVRWPAACSAIRPW